MLPVGVFFLFFSSPGAMMEDPHWQSFMEQAVRLTYFLAESPDQLCSRLIQRTARLLLDQISEGAEVNKDVDQPQEGSQESGEQGERQLSLPSACPFPPPPLTPTPSTALLLDTCSPLPQ